MPMNQNGSISTPTGIEIDTETDYWYKNSHVPEIQQSTDFNTRLYVIVVLSMLINIIKIIFNYNILIC